MQNPDFTIITTLWSDEDLLPRLIDSALMQTHQSWELLIMADGPHPKTRERFEYLLSFPDLRDRLRWEEHLRFEGTYGNILRGRALRSARGKNVCWIGHDCLLYHDYLATHWEHLRDRKCLSVVHINHWRVCDKEFVRRGVFPRKDPNEVVTSEIDLTCYAAPREDAEAVGAFSEDLKYHYDADYHTFDRLRARLPVATSYRVCAAHF